MGDRTVMQEALFYSFRIEDHVPADHLLRSIDRFVDLTGIREHLKPFYSEVGRPSIDPELMIRMLIIGYCMGIRSERRLCEEMHLNLAYRWFCRLDLDGAIPDHSTFSKNRHGRFRDSDLLRKLFEMTVERRRRIWLFYRWLTATFPLCDRYSVVRPPRHDTRRDSKRSGPACTTARICREFSVPAFGDVLV